MCTNFVVLLALMMGFNTVWKCNFLIADWWCACETSGDLLSTCCFIIQWPLVCGLLCLFCLRYIVGCLGLCLRCWSVGKEDFTGIKSQRFGGSCGKYGETEEHWMEFQVLYMLSNRLFWGPCTLGCVCLGPHSCFIFSWLSIVFDYVILIL